MAKKIPIEQRFWSKVIKGPGCWSWNAGKDKDGYGCIRWGSERRAHRVSWKLHYGPIPDGMWVLHKCDNMACSNPEHLYLGDNDQNCKDREARGRGNQAKGSNSGLSKLTEQDVIEIRSRTLAGKRGIQSVLAREFGVGRKAISKIVLGQRWRHV